MLKVTIITVCLNEEKRLEETIGSVLSQTWPGIEYILIDGGSTDETLEILSRFRNRIANVVSEKDGGIYDAMNKGLKLATGDVVYFLNAGDRFFDENIVSSIVNVFEAEPRLELVLGRVKGIHAPAGESQPIPSCEARFARPSEILIHGICHQRLFAKRALFERIGAFDPGYAVCADQEWVFRAIYQKAKMFFGDPWIAYYDLSGFSRRNKLRMYAEGLRARFRNMPAREFLWFLGPVFYVAIRRRILNFLRIKPKPI